MRLPCQCDHDQNGNPGISGGNCVQCGRRPKNFRANLKQDIIEALDNGLQNDYMELLTMPPNEVLLDLMTYDKAIEEADPISDQHPDDLIPELMKTITDWQENRRTK